MKREGRNCLQTFLSGKQHKGTNHVPSTRKKINQQERNHAAKIPYIKINELKRQELFCSQMYEKDMTAF